MGTDGKARLKILPIAKRGLPPHLTGDGKSTGGISHALGEQTVTFPLKFYLVRFPYPFPYLSIAHQAWMPRTQQIFSIRHAMEDGHSVNSPRRILSFSKRRRATVSFFDPNDKAYPGFGLSGVHGPKSSEVYGFVGAITTVVATAIFLVWAYVPEPWLHFIGINYYPDRYWALAVPTYAMVAVVLALVFYVGLNFISSPPPTSLNTVYDEFSREPSNIVSLGEGDDEPIQPMSDIGINRINELMFAD